MIEVVLNGVYGRERMKKIRCEEASPSSWHTSLQAGPSPGQLWPESLLDSARSTSIADTYLEYSLVHTVAGGKTDKIVRVRLRPVLPYRCSDILKLLASHQMPLAIVGTQRKAGQSF